MAKQTKIALLLALVALTGVFFFISDSGSPASPEADLEDLSALNDSLSGPTNQSPAAREQARTHRSVPRIIQSPIAVDVAPAHCPNPSAASRICLLPQRSRHHSRKTHRTSPRW